MEFNSGFKGLIMYFLFEVFRIKNVQNTRD